MKIYPSKNKGLNNKNSQSESKNENKTQIKNQNEILTFIIFTLKIISTPD